MFAARLAAATVFAAALALPSTSNAEAPPSPQPCFFHEHRVLSVSALQVDEHHGKVTLQRLGGAELYILAEPGLTAEWLRVELWRRVNASPGTDCAFAVPNLRTEVDSAGMGFRVRLFASDAKTAEEVLRRSRLLAG